ncbi:LysR family transcriptional regulator, partial [Klebsiella pneumoniae]|nr:LysR family transcriptional regulator [Klebsiella pneumoniae]
AVAGQGVVIASELLARDLLQRGVLSAPFSNALPGARYYLVTTEAAAQRADIINLREWLVGQMALGDGRHPAEE